MRMTENQLSLVIKVAANRGIKVLDVINNIHTKSMIECLGRKGILALTDDRLYICLEVWSKFKLKE